MHAFAINSALVSGPCVNGAPDRGASRSPCIPSRVYRPRHFVTVGSEHPTRSQISRPLNPSAAASTGRHS